MDIQITINTTKKDSIEVAIGFLNGLLNRFNDKMSQVDKLADADKPLENGVIKKDKKAKKEKEEEFDLTSNLETSSSDIPDAGSDLLPEPEEKKKPEKELTLDNDVKPAFAAYVKQYGSEGRIAAKQMLSENFGVENLPSLKAKDYKKALKLLSEL